MTPSHTAPGTMYKSAGSKCLRSTSIRTRRQPSGHEFTPSLTWLGSLAGTRSAVNVPVQTLSKRTNSQQARLACISTRYRARAHIYKQHCKIATVPRTFIKRIHVLVDKSQRPNLHIPCRLAGTAIADSYHPASSATAMQRKPALLSQHALMIVWALVPTAWARQCTTRILDR